MLPYLVIDQNQLRKADFVANAVSRCRERGLRILVPDGAGFEMSKSAEVFDTLRNSLQLLATCGKMVVVSSKMTDMMSIEVDSGHPMRDVVDQGASELFRDLLGDLGSGRLSSLGQLVAGPVAEKMPASLAIWSDFEQHRTQILAMRDLLKNELTEPVVKQLRRDPESELAAWMSSVHGVRFVYQGIKSKGADDVSALRLAALPSILGGFITSLALVALNWLALGGLESAKPEKVTNDLHDIEYSVLGSISADLLTSDNRLNAIKGAAQAAQHSRTNWVKSQLASSQYESLIATP